MKKNSIHNFFSSTLRDIIIYGVIIILLVGVAYYKFNNSDDFFNDLSDYIGMITIILFGVIGIFEFSYDNGLSLLVPPSFVDYKKAREKKQMKYYIDDYLREEQHIINQYNNERISFFLAQLGLSQSDFEVLKKEIVSIKLLPLHDRTEAEKKLTSIITSGNIIFNQKKQETKKLLYKKVDYFINFTDVMYVKDYSDELVDCMVMLIQETLKERLSDVNKIIIPYKSNRMLGFGVGEKIGKAIINVTREPHIFEGQCWEGHFDTGRKNVGIIIHDVLVTGEQVLNSIKKVETQCYVEHVFCLVDRVDGKGRTMLKDAGYTVHSLLNLPDSKVEELLREDDIIDNE